MKQTELEFGLRLRDQGISTILENSGDWQTVAGTDFVNYLMQHGPATVSAWKLNWCQRSQPLPHHVNAWGALTIKLAKAKRIHWTGKIDKAITASRHAGMNKIWSV